MADKLIETINYILVTMAIVFTLTSNLMIVVILLIATCACQQWRIDHAKNKTKTIQLQLHVYQEFICKQLRKYKEGIRNGKITSKKNCTI